MRSLGIALALAGAIPAICACGAQSRNRPSTEAADARSVQSTIPVLMVSDIHFDPFHDPARAKLLARAPVSEWSQILASPGSPGQAAGYARLQTTCHARGVDTPYALLQSSVRAMRRQGRPRFVTLTGDLLAHQFDCRYQTTVGGSAADYDAFAVKTFQFVVAQVRGAWPGVPVYIALGNNDSGCGDYHADPDGAFLRQAAAIVGQALPPSLRHAEQQEFPTGGYYAIAMAAPMRNTRLIVLNDNLLSPKYRTCQDVRDAAPGQAEMAWLGSELAQAQRAGQNVWVMGHIPPGMDAYATVAKSGVACGGKVSRFLVRSGLDDRLTRYGAEVRLALFAHTHMDEMRLIPPKPGKGQAVAVKLVPSITPVHGNNPAFIVAHVNPRTAVLEDYAVIAASDRTGTHWAREYDYAQTYHEPNYTAASLRRLIAGFSSDPRAKTAASQNYMTDYYAGGIAAELKPFWPLYVCSMDHMTAKGYSACVCGDRQSAPPR